MPCSHTLPARPRWQWPCAVVTALATLGAAHTHAVAADPTRADALVPPLRYESALGTYRPLVAEHPLPWAQANERVNQIGGWRTYTREAHAPEPATASTPASAPQPAPENPHAHQ